MGHQVRLYQTLGTEENKKGKATFSSFSCLQSFVPASLCVLTKGRVLQSAATIQLT